MSSLDLMAKEKKNLREGDEESIKRKKRQKEKGRSFALENKLE